VGDAALLSNWLPKPVRDRIHRYAKEGREPRVRYSKDGCLLMAVAMNQIPVVILRATKEQFDEMRSAALVEWTKASGRKALVSKATAKWVV
jgi:hypothetical protein